VKGRATVAAAEDTDADTEQSAPASPEETPRESVSAPEESKKPEPQREKLSPTMRKIRDDEEQSLKAWLETIGTQGAFKVQLRRTEPATCWDTRKNDNVKVKGYLGTFDHTIDEAFIAREYGGGTFALRVTRQGADGSYQYEKGLHRTIEIAGEPRTDRLPSNAPQAPPQAPASHGESGTVVQHALDMMERMVSKQGAHEPKGIDPAMAMLVEQMRESQRTQAKEMAELRAELSQARNQKPPEDPFRDRMLDKLIDGDSARVTALRTQHDSEIRMLKEGHQQEIRLLEDRHDRAMKQVQQSHEIMLANMKASYEREIAAVNTAHQVAATATSTTKDVTVTTLNAEIRRMETELAALRTENKELRERKDKSVIEQIKDMKVLKEALGDGEDGEGSTIKEAIAMIPAAIEGIGGIVANRAAAQQPQQAQARAVATQQQQRPRVVAAQNGERLMQVGNKLVPVKPKPKVVTTDAGETIEIPKIEDSTLKLIISQLEAAFGRDEDPNIVAQTAKAMIPPDILAWIRQHHTEQVAGVDLFMQKVAKLPGTSPLATQGGRNWLRKVGAALIGE
jgi:hypothetical protein